MGYFLQHCRGLLPLRCNWRRGWEQKAVDRKGKFGLFTSQCTRQCTGGVRLPFGRGVRQDGRSPARMGDCHTFCLVAFHALVLAAQKRKNGERVEIDPHRCARTGEEWDERQETKRTPLKL